MKEDEEEVLWKEAESGRRSERRARSGWKRSKGELKRRSKSWMRRVMMKEMEEEAWEEVSQQILTLSRLVPRGSAANTTDTAQWMSGEVGVGEEQGEGGRGSGRSSKVQHCFAVMWLKMWGEELESGPAIKFWAEYLPPTGQQET